MKQPTNETVGSVRWEDRNFKILNCKHREELETILYIFSIFPEENVGPRMKFYVQEKACFFLCVHTHAHRLCVVLMMPFLEYLAQMCERPVKIACTSKIYLQMEFQNNLVPYCGKILTDRENRKNP